MKILAHRGYRAKYPENTMLAFEKAIEAGCDGMELDVQLTRDGEMVIIHDETVDRTTNGHGSVVDMTLAEIRALDAGEGQCVPTLGEYLNLVEKLPIITNIELKNSVVPYEGVEEMVIAEIRRRGLEDRIIFSSFKHDSVIKCKRIAPDIKCGLLCTRDELMPWKYPKIFSRIKDNGIEYLHPGTYSLTLDLLEAAADADIQLTVWTVNNPNVVRRLDKEGCVYAVVTDEPESMNTLGNIEIKN